MMSAAAVVHGGALSDPATRDGCERALEVALSVLSAQQSSAAQLEVPPTRAVLRAAVAAVVVMEDDGRFNAGSGAIIRLDGSTVQMDAAVAVSDGRFGAVAAIEDVSNPVLVAEQVLGTPHLLIAGAGATALARRHGLGSGHVASEHARRRYAKLKERLIASGFTAADQPFDEEKLREGWNFESNLDEILGTCDTVGACVRDREGNFAAAGSTGGTAITLRGRVGDTPLYGAGLFAGPHGAVAATGVGEEIIRAFACKRVYDWIEAGVPAQTACERGALLVPERFAIGLIAVDSQGTGAASNCAMTWVASTDKPSTTPR